LAELHPLFHQSAGLSLEQIAVFDGIVADGVESFETLRERRELLRAAMTHGIKTGEGT
jgi:hypothetical protein